MTKLSKGEAQLLKGVIAGIGNVFVAMTDEDRRNAMVLCQRGYFERVRPPEGVYMPVYLFRPTAAGRAALESDSHD